MRRTTCGKERCSNKLVSGIEERTGLCVTCMEGRLGEYDDLLEEKRAFQLEITGLRSRSEKLEKIISLMSCEKQGLEASERGLPEEQNPHPAGSDESLAWLGGWHTGELRRRTSQAYAVLRWTRQVVLSAQELANGYGQSEIAGRLATVVEKIGPFLE